VINRSGQEKVIRHLEKEIGATFPEIEYLFQLVVLP
jgi:hypothetical protein